MNIFKELEKGSLPSLKRAISLYPNSVNAKNPAGATPLHIAAGLGQVAFVKELLVHGAQHDTTDSQGNIPLHLAAEQGIEETVAELLAGRKTAAKAKNKEGQIPLHLAVARGHKAVVLRLLEANNRTDVKDKAGNTPLSLAEDEEMRQILTNGRASGTEASISQRGGFTARGTDGAAGNPRGTSAGGTVTPLAPNSSRASLASASSIAGSDGGAAAGTPVTPRIGGAATQAGARAPQTVVPGTSGLSTGGRTPPPASNPSGSLTSRLPRNTPSPAVSGGGASTAAASVSAVAVIQLQQQKYDSAIQSLKDGLRAATERLCTLDTCTAAQLECAGQVERVLETCGNHGRAILDLETRIAFQEERGRDARVRLERLEEGERDRQESVKHLTDDHRSLNGQMQRLADKVAANSSAQAQRLASSGDLGSPLSVQPQLQAELAVLRAQLDQLSPALALATAASAEARTLAARVDMMQQQLLQQQQQPVPQQHASANAAMEPQVLQLQAQVQLLQLPVASLTQQCADLSSRMAGLAEWQQQARAELTRLAEAAEQSAGDRLTDAVMGVLDTTARSLNELRQQQDETAKQVALLLQQQQQQQQQNVLPPSPSPSAGPPAVPATPQSVSQRASGSMDPGMGPFGMQQSRMLNGHISLGSLGRDSVAQAEVRAELESLKSLVADIRKEVATEGGSLRREWQRAFSDMQSRYGEQTNELRAREANIAKLREAALVEEAERRAASGFEEKFSTRLGKLETNVDYLTHRLEVLEEQLSGVVSSLAGATSPVAPLSPSRMAAAMAAMRSQLPTSRSGPGPVTENHSGVRAAQESKAGLTPTVAMVTSAMSPSPLPKNTRFRSAAGPTPAGTGNAAAKSEGGCLRRGGVPFFSTTGAKDPTASNGGAGENTTDSGAASAREACTCSARSTDDCGAQPEQWWRAANAASPEKLEEAPAYAEAGPPPTTWDADGSSPRPVQSSIDVTSVDAATTVPTRPRQGSAADPRSAACSAPGGAASGQLSARGDLMTTFTAGGPAAAAVNCSPRKIPQQQQPCGHGHAGRTALGQGTPREGAVPELEPAPATAAAALPQRGPVSTPGLTPTRGDLTRRSQPSQPGLGGGVLDPANVALGPQLLTPAAHALLAPSVDIQRLAAAANVQHLTQQLAQHWQQQAVLAQQQPVLTMTQPWGGGQQEPQQAGPLAVGLGGWGADGAGGTVGPDRLSMTSPNRGGERQQPSSEGRSRKEPPMCLFCPMQ